MRERLIFIVALLCGALPAACGGPVRGQQQQEPVVVTVSVADNGVATFTVDVNSVPANKRWKNLHLHARAKHSFPRLEGGTNVVVTDSAGGETQIWTRKGSTSRHIHIYADGEAGFGEGTYTFQIDFKGSRAHAWKVRSCHFDATSNGKRTYNDAGVLDDEDGQNVPQLPQVGLSINQDEEATIRAGLVNTLQTECEDTLAGRSYRIYSSASLNEDFDDALGIGINSETDPVPPGWGLTFHRFQGTIGAGGVISPAPAVEVPDDDSLDGRAFYLVLAVVDGGGIDYASEPVRVTIRKEP